MAAYGPGARRQTQVGWPAVYSSLEGLVLKIWPERETTVSISCFLCFRNYLPFHPGYNSRPKHKNNRSASKHFLQDTAINCLDYFNWQLLDTDKPAEEIPWNVEHAAQWIAGALVRRRFPKEIFGSACTRPISSVWRPRRSRPGLRSWRTAGTQWW